MYLSLCGYESSYIFGCVPVYQCIHVYVHLSIYLPLIEKYYTC